MIAQPAVRLGRTQHSNSAARSVSNGMDARPSDPLDAGLRQDARWAAL